MKWAISNTYGCIVRIYNVYSFRNFILSSVWVRIYATHCYSCPSADNLLDSII